MLRRFCVGRRSLYIECVQGSLDDNMFVMATALSTITGMEVKEYDHIKEALDDILEICKAEPTVVVMDELPYLLSSAVHVASSLQHFIDAVDRETDSMVVVCGSSMSVMKRETTDYDRPLYGRFFHRMHITPMSYRECAEFHPDMSDLDRLMLYLTVGGIPKYHLDRETTTYRSYIEKHFFAPGADMVDEAESIISAEFAPRDRYMAVVSAIVRGSTSLKEIADKTGLERTMCSRCLTDLEDVGIVSVVHPMFGAPRRPVYSVPDSMIAFCLSVVRASRGMSVAGADFAYNMMEVAIHTFLGHRFEFFCADYVKANYKVIDVGRWWGVDSEREVREIDVAAAIMEGEAKVSLFGECKFRRRIIGATVLRELMADSDLADVDTSRRFVLFSVSGFSDELIDLADANAVDLVGLSELTGEWESGSGNESDGLDQSDSKS